MPDTVLPQVVVGQVLAVRFQELIHYKDLSQVERIEFVLVQVMLTWVMFSQMDLGLGGLRYCINSASLRFVAKDEMERGRIWLSTAL